MRHDLNGDLQFFHKFTLKAIHRTLAELQTAAWKFGHIDAKPELISHENLVAINQKSVNPDIETIYFHLLRTEKTGEKLNERQGKFEIPGK